MPVPKKFLDIELQCEAFLKEDDLLQVFVVFY